jgi:predicted metalloprotease with PDZ domain
MHDLLRTASGGTRELTAEVVAAHIERHLGRDVMPDIERNILNGELIEPAADALGGGFALQIVSTPVFDLGFDLQALQKTREIAGVITGSAAYNAGLRDGQKLAGGFSFSLGDTSKAIELKVSADGDEKVIRYLPVAEEKVAIPQFRPSQ